MEPSEYRIPVTMLCIRCQRCETLIPVAVDGPRARTRLYQAKCPACGHDSMGIAKATKTQ